jgi:hypothetical protein
MMVSSTDPLSTRVLRLSAICGCVAPVLFAGLVILLGALEPGYDHRTQMMSVLGGVGGWRGAAFLVGGALTGLLLIPFAYGLHWGIDEGGGGPGARIGPILIGIAGIGMIGSAVFHCDQGCANVLRAPTLAGRLHMVFALLTGAPFAIAPFFFLPRLASDERWARYRWFSLASGLLGNIPGITMWVSFLTVRMRAWEGVLQRLGVVFPLLWVEVMAIRLLQLSLWDRSGDSVL